MISRCFSSGRAANSLWITSSTVSYSLRLPTSFPAPYPSLSFPIFRAPFSLSQRNFPAKHFPFTAPECGKVHSGLRCRIDSLTHEKAKTCRFPSKRKFFVKTRLTDLLFEQENPYLCPVCSRPKVRVFRMGASAPVYQNRKPTQQTAVDPHSGTAHLRSTSVFACGENLGAGRNSLPP